MGTHPIFESDFDCLTEIVMIREFIRKNFPFRRAFLYTYRKKRYLLFKQTDRREVAQWYRDGGKLLSPPKLTTVDLIRLPFEYKPRKIQHFVFHPYHRPCAELQFPGLAKHPVLSNPAYPSNVVCENEIKRKLDVHFGSAEQLELSWWSGDIRQMQKKDVLKSSTQEAIKKGQLNLFGKMGVCVKSMEVKNIIPGVRNWLLLSKMEKQLIFAEESRICSIFAEQSVLPTTKLYWRLGAQFPVWFNRLNFLLFYLIIIYPGWILFQMVMKDARETYGQLYVPEALY